MEFPMIKILPPKRKPDSDNWIRWNVILLNKTPFQPLIISSHVLVKVVLNYLRRRSQVLYVKSWWLVPSFCSMGCVWRPGGRGSGRRGWWAWLDQSWGSKVSKDLFWFFMPFHFIRKLRLKADWWFKEEHLQSCKIAKPYGFVQHATFSQKITKMNKRNNTRSKPLLIRISIYN